MDIEYKKDLIKFEKVLNSLDKFAIDFTSILNKLNIKYVLVSGYVSILFGRSRSSEDIDIFIEKINFEKFTKLWTNLYNEFECITIEDPKSAFKDYLKNNVAIRFSYKNRYIPNIEIKFDKLDVETWCLNNRKKVVLNNKTLFISPIELQIPVKFRLGSDKDIEDAKHLYLVFKDYLNKEQLQKFNQKFNIQELFDKEIK